MFQTAQFKTHDQTTLFYRYHLGDLSKPPLIILHGQGEHTGRYEKFKHKLESLGIPIALFDYRGHGQSEGEEDYVETFAHYLEDVSAFMAHIHEKHGMQSKGILFGHSLGGLVAVQWALQHPKDLRGLILSSPCLGLRLPGFLISFNQWMNRYFPRFIYRNVVYPWYLTHDPEELAQYRADDLIHRKISARLTDEMIKCLRQLEETKEFSFSFPVHILAAGDERVVDLKATEKFYQRLHCPNKSLKIYPGHYHEIFHEIEQDRVFLDLQAIIKSILAI